MVEGFRPGFDALHMPLGRAVVLGEASGQQDGLRDLVLPNDVLQDLRAHVEVDL